MAGAGLRGRRAPAGQGPVRGWPVDDPAIDDLPDDVLVHGPDGQAITAAELRATLRLADGTDAYDRTETAAAAEPDDAGQDGDIALWLVAAGFLAVVVLAVSRLGAARKQVRPKA